MCAKDRRRIGPFVITEEKDLDKEFVKCNFCNKVIAKIDDDDDMIPSIEELLELQNVPIPNFGWFCGQKCAVDYEKEFKIQFERDNTGKINYY